MTAMSAVPGFVTRQTLASAAYLLPGVRRSGDTRQPVDQAAEPLLDELEPDDPDPEDPEDPDPEDPEDPDPDEPDDPEEPDPEEPELEDPELDEPESEDFEPDFALLSPDLLAPSPEEELDLSLDALIEDLPSLRESLR
jgi:hypothetical protein